MPSLTKVCSVDECDREPRARGLCNRHWQRWWKYGDVNRVMRPTGDRHPRWSGDTPSYATLHKRINAQRGRASDYDCDCGNQARHWAYDHADPDEVKGPFRSGNGKPITITYSLKPEHYKPMCATCHWHWDRSPIRKDS